MSKIVVFFLFELRGLTKYCDLDCKKNFLFEKFKNSLQ